MNLFFVHLPCYILFILSYIKNRVIYLGTGRAAQAQECKRQARFLQSPLRNRRLVSYISLAQQITDIKDIFSVSGAWEPSRSDEDPSIHFCDHLDEPCRSWKTCHGSTPRRATTQIFIVQNKCCPLSRLYAICVR